MNKVENVKIVGWDAAIRAIRGPRGILDQSDSYATHIEDPVTMETAEYQFFVGEKDKELMLRLVEADDLTCGFRRIIVVYADITAPVSWWDGFIHRSKRITPFDPFDCHQQRTVMLNYEVLSGMYRYWRESDIEEWQHFCQWIESLPHSDLITCDCEV